MFMPTNVCVCTTYIPGAYEGHKREKINLLKLELEMVVCCYMGTRNQSRFLEEKPVNAFLSLLLHSPVPSPRPISKRILKPLHSYQLLLHVLSVCISDIENYILLKFRGLGPPCNYSLQRLK